MPGSKYTDKQERKAKHIEESYEEKGVSEKEAKSRAWATVNKQDGGGKKPGGSGQKKSSSKKTSSKKRASTTSSSSRKRAAAGRKGGKAKARKAA
jgi:plasmid stabilization system protein ParE